MNPQRYERWNDIDWTYVQLVTFKLQKRIFRASKRGEVEQVKKLQRLLINGFLPKLLAVHTVTTINQGKNTAGIDRRKKLNDEEKWELAMSLGMNYEAKPTRRVWIDKPGKKEKRPLGIPIMEDRARQALVKLALEPEWEAKFEENSYGFRKGRSCHDAIAMIFNSLKIPKYCLDADIAGCFDNINHSYLLNKLNTSTSIRRQVKAWLKSGVIDGKTFTSTTQGTPQGGVLSPLLANIALHGMEDYIKDKILEEFPRQYTTTGRRMGKESTRMRLSFIRYADDFVIMHPLKEVVERTKALIDTWLKDIGLQLKDSKTKIVHTLNNHEQHEPGFDFLGFNVRHYSVGKHNRNRYGKHKLLIKPSKEKIQTHYRKIKEIVHKSTHLSVKALCSKLNPIIKGWANYYKYVVSSQVFRDLDNRLYDLQWIWSKRKHPKSGLKFLKRKYFTSIDGTWRLSYRENGEINHVEAYRSTKVQERFVKVKGDRTPFDGDWVYWSQRLIKYPGIDNLTATLLKRQSGKCTECGKYISQEDNIQRDRIIPLALGGKNKLDNMQVIHKQCHIEKTKKDLIEINKNRKEGNTIISTKERKKRYRNNYVFG